MMDGLTLKTYGLPYIFWAYAGCSIGVIIVMFLAIKQPVLKLVALGDQADAVLGHGLLGFIGFLPIAILSFFFFEKRIISREKTIKMEYRVFGVKFFSKKYSYNSPDDFSVDSFLDSPNVARINAQQENLGFQNKGYHVLWLHQNKKRIAIDRHSRKSDLVKLKELITSGK